MSDDPPISRLERLEKENENLRGMIADPELYSRLAAIVESTDDAVVSKTLRGVIRTWNKGAERIFGWKAEEVIGKPIDIIIPPERRQEEPQILSQIQRGVRVDHFETVRITKSGERIEVSVTISPVRDASGTIVAASKIARDITSQKRLLRQLEEAKEAAEKANRAKDEFLSALSHELRTPLTPVLAELSYLEELPEENAGELASRLATIRRNVETEARLVDDLLDITRIVHGKLELHFEVVDVNSVVRAVAGMLQNEIDRKGIELTLGLRAERHQVWADAGRLQQIFLNLLSNAVKFTPADGAIALRTRAAEGGRIEIAVSDTGVGVDEEMLPRLFSRFEQGNANRHFGGLGLGLAIARALVEKHHGSIRASSGGKGQGSVFSVELPLTEDTAKPAAGSRGTDKRRAHGLRVLLVEDHLDTRNAMSRLLTAMGCDVLVASNVAEAIAVGEGQPIDLLISDLGLPDGSGLEIMRRLRQRQVRGIALTGYGQPEDLQRSRDAGFERHVTKPVNFQALREIVFEYAS